MADLGIGRLNSSPGTRPAPKAPSQTASAQTEGYAGSVEGANARRYTVISLLGASLGSGVGAETETREYVEKLAPQIQDNSLAVVILGTYRVGGQNAWLSRRYAIDQHGVRDTTAGLSGFHIADASFKQTKVSPAQGEDVSALHPETVKRHILEAMREFPAEHYIFHTNAHGSNVKGLAGCPNERFSKENGESFLFHYSRHDQIDLPALQQVFAEVQAETGKKMSIIDIDTCLMGFQEVNSALQHQTDFIVSSPAVEKGIPAGPNQVERSGHQQVEVFQKILHNPQVTPQELAQEFIQVNAREGIVHDTGQVYHAAPTLSAFSSLGIGQLNESLDQLGGRLLKELKAKPERGLFSFFKKARPPGQRIQAAIDQTRVFRSSKGDPYLDLQHFAQNLAAQYPDDEEMQKLTGGVQQGVDQAALASYKGVGEEDGKLIDYKGWGPLGVFLPGGKDNLFTQGLVSHYRSSEGRMQSDPIEFWGRSWKKADQLRLSPDELKQLESIHAQAQSYRELPARERVEKAQELPNFQSPLAQKIWAQEVSREMPGWDEYNRTPNLPPVWKEFVQTWTVQKLTQAWRTGD